MIDLYRINLNLLVALDVLLSEGSVTRAANKLFLTQAAMSNNLQQLREIFKDDLLLRDKSRMVPTSYAISLQPRLHQVLEQLRTVILAGQSFCAQASQRNFKIGMSDYMANLILPKLLCMLEQKASNIKITVVPIKANGMIDSLDQDEIDLMIGKLENPKIAAEREVLFTDRAVCVLNPEHPLAKKKTLTLDDFLEYEQVGLKTNQPDIPTLIESALLACNATRKVKISTAYIGPIFEIIQHSKKLIGTAPESVAKIYAEHYDFVTKPVPFVMDEIPFYLVWHPRHNNDLGLIWLREQLRNLCQN